MDYFIDPKLLRDLHIPMAFIFDGDLRKKDRHKKVKNLINASLKSTNKMFYQLKKNSIANYILSPRSIRESFPNPKVSEEDFEIFLQANAAKQNKKAVLDYYLRQTDLGKYRIEVAHTIAKNMQASEIDEEIVSMFSIMAELSTGDPLMAWRKI